VTPTSVHLRRLESPDELAPAAALAREFGHYASEQLEAEHGIVLADELDHSPDQLEKLLESGGRLYLAEVGGEHVGIGGLKLLGDGVGEVKRMFVRPSARGLGVGRLIVEQLIADARELGCDRVVLESASFMHAAHTLYRSVGFVPTGSYAGREFEEFDHDGVVFMWLDLTSS
jgi:GNAT superfamily N-acetyltransferase